MTTNSKAPVRRCESAATVSTHCSRQASGNVRSIGRWRDFRGRKFEDETGADGRVVFDAEQAVVLGDDSGSDSEAEAGAAILGGEMRQEKFVLVGGRDALAGVFHGDFDGIGFGVE